MNKDIHHNKVWFFTSYLLWSVFFRTIKSHKKCDRVFWENLFCWCLLLNFTVNFVSAALLLLSLTLVCLLQNDIKNKTGKNEQISKIKQSASKIGLLNNLFYGTVINYPNKLNLKSRSFFTWYRIIGKDKPVKQMLHLSCSDLVLSVN